MAGECHAKRACGAVADAFRNLGDATFFPAQQFRKEISTQASEAYERAQALAPGNAQVLRQSGIFAVLMGNFDAGLAALRRAVVLDPLARLSHYLLGQALYRARESAPFARPATVSLAAAELGSPSRHGNGDDAGSDRSYARRASYRRD
jgi:tetratricopeptide (TPR) repeat protein